MSLWLILYTSCYCTVDTELIDGNNFAKNQFNGFITTVEVNGFHSFSFAFQFSSFQGAARTKYRMSAFGKVEHHAFSSFVPFTIRFADMSSVPCLLQSKLPKRPMSSRESSSILCNSVSIRNTIFSVSSLSQSISLYIDMKMILPLSGSGSHFWLCHHLLSLAENSQCSEPWEIFPHEFPSLPSRSDTNLWNNVLPKTIYSYFPMLWLVQYWSLIDTALSQKRRKFWQLHMNSSVSYQSRLSPHRMLPIIRCQSSIFCLISDQPLSHLK